jgi:hypothetical protein
MSMEERLERLTTIVEILPSSVVAHHSQIEALLKIAEKHTEQIASMERQLQAYINTLPRSACRPTSSQIGQV